MNPAELTEQYRGATLPKLIETHVKSLSQESLVQAIRGTYEKLPITFRPQADAYTMAYLKNWLGPHIVTADLADVFAAAVSDIKAAALEARVSLSDDQVLDVFNIMVMRMAHFAHSKPDLRKMLGIKKGWFS